MMGLGYPYQEGVRQSLMVSLNLAPIGKAMHIC